MKTYKILERLIKDLDQGILVENIEHLIPEVVSPDKKFRASNEKWDNTQRLFVGYGLTAKEAIQDLWRDYNDRT